MTGKSRIIVHEIHVNHEAPPPVPRVKKQARTLEQLMEPLVHTKPPGAPRSSTVALVFLALGLVGCRGLARTPLLGEHPEVRDLPRFEGVRAVNGFPSSSFQSSFTEALRRRAEAWRSAKGTDARAPTFQMLVLGAGGPNGAFGAGLLVGWTESGERPLFDLVTGVSAGALLAPFAFVGEEGDSTLEHVFARLSPKDIYSKKGVLGALAGESLMGRDPLWSLIVEHVEMDLLDAVASGHEQGRRLYVGTTDFDVGRLVVWDLGAIAVLRSPEALDLFRRVLLASAAIPVFYPPVLFEVQDDSGRIGDEMHVDGALVSPMFMPNQVYDAWQAAEDADVGDFEEVRAVLTVIHNGSLAPPATGVKRRTVDIATRTFLIVSSSMVQEDLLQLYVLSRVWDAEFRFACIPDQEELSVVGFTSDDAERLFDYGHSLGRDPDSWETSPPMNLIPEELREISASARSSTR